MPETAGSSQSNHRWQLAGHPHPCAAPPTVTTTIHRGGCEDRAAHPQDLPQRVVVASVQTGSWQRKTVPSGSELPLPAKELRRREPPVPRRAERRLSGGCLHFHPKPAMERVLTAFAVGRENAVESLDRLPGPTTQYRTRAAAARKAGSERSATRDFRRHARTLHHNRQTSGMPKWGWLFVCCDSGGRAARLTTKHAGK